MQIRAMQPPDYQKVYALWLACKGIGLNNLDDSEAGITAFLTRNPETCFVAEDADEIIGVILAGNDGRRGYIYHTAVHPSHRKQQIGKALVAAVLDGLRKCGIHKVALVVFSQNETGNAFWEHLGFTERKDLTYRNMTLDEMIRYDL